jgi:photosystem II stability/assembly factor-like uncharacterized protein
MNIFKISLILGALLLTSEPLIARDFDAFEYRNIGPARGGRVTAVAGTVAAPATFYLGASGGGVWKTEDYGTRWYVVSDGYFDSPSIGDISVAQNDPNIVYVGTGSDGLRSNVISGNGMYKSIDGGETWEHIGLTETGHIGAVEIDPSNHNIVWVAAIGQAFNANEERGVYKTEDGGKTWNKMLFISDKIGISDIELLPGNPNIVFATAWKTERKPWTIISGGTTEEGGIYKSVDGGQNWEKIIQGLPQGLIGKIDLAVTPADSRIVYALVEALHDEGGLYKSIDQGKTFKQVSNNYDIRTRPFYYANIEVDPQNPDIIFAMATKYSKSIDGGKTWKKLTPPHGDNHDMWINPENPNLFIQANDGGANVTHNAGQTWSTQFNQPTAELYQVEVDDQYPYWLYAGQQDNSTTIAVPSMPPFRAQHNAAWLVDAGGCETGPAVPNPSNHNIVYANCKGRFSVFDKRIGTERSYYVGATNMYGHNPKDLVYRFQRVSPIHVSPHDPSIVYHASQYVHQTTNEGKTWKTISPDLTAFEADKQVISGSPITRDITGEEIYSTIYSLRESPLRQGVIWVGANDGPVHLTQDGGTNWQEVTPRGLPRGGRVDAVEASPHNAAKAYIAVLRYQLGDRSPYIYKTENYGRRWSLLTTGNNGIPDNYPTRVVREDPVKEGLLYAGTEQGMFVSFDDGENWQTLQQNLPITPVTDIKIHRGDLVISTMGRSFWVLDNISTLRQEGIRHLDEDIVLFKPKNTIRYRQVYAAREDNAVPHYPAPAVVIDYYLPDGSTNAVKLEIINSNGEVANTYHSADEAESDNENNRVTVIEDMSMNEVNYINDETLTAEPGMNRFRWNMKYLGPWNEDEVKRFMDGPLAAPGRYTARLIVGDSVSEQKIELLVDPRVADTGTTINDIKEQFAFELKMVALLTDARKLEHSLLKEWEHLEEKNESDFLSERESQRLTKIEVVLDTLKTADIIYPQPMLTDQISYLYNMISNADQAPGKEAEDRYQELNKRFNSILASLNH